MLPFEIPKGTTLTTLVEEVVPAAHARLVPASAGRESFVVAFELEGEGQWVMALDGPKMTVRKGDEKAPDARFRVRASDAQAFLDDALGPQRLAPKTKPGGEMIMLGDPRLLKRIKLVSGAVELVIRDFDEPGVSGTRRIAIAIALGAVAKKVEPDPDVVIETSMKTYLKLLGGEMGPEDALADGDVTVKGKRMLAMQLALAIGPLFPPKR